MRRPALYLVLLSSLSLPGSVFARRAAAAPAAMHGSAVQVHESAQPDAKVVQALPEGTQPDTADKTTEVKPLSNPPSGQEAHVDDDAVEIVKAEAAPKPSACPPAPRCSCKEQPRRMPTFVVDWGHLAELTKSDADVFARAEMLERRQAGASLLARSAIGVGLAIVALGTIDRLATGAWRDGMPWAVAGGVAAAVISAVSAWNYAPDHGDLADAVNLWNRRHPDKPLAP